MKPLLFLRANSTLIIALIGASTGILAVSLQLMEKVEYYPRVEAELVDVYDDGFNTSEFISYPWIYVKLKLQNKGKIKATLEGPPELIVRWDNGKMNKKYSLGDTWIIYPEDYDPNFNNEYTETRLRILEPFDIIEEKLSPKSIDEDIENGLIPDIRLEPEKVTFELVGKSSVGNYKATKKGLTFTNPYYWSLDRFKKDIQKYNKTLREDPLNAEIWMSKGWAYYMLDKKEEALRAYNEAINLSENDPDLNLSLATEVWYCKGLALMDLSRYEEAYYSFKNSTSSELGRTPNYYFGFSPLADAWYNEGAALYHLGKYEEAIQCYENGSKENNSYSLAWNLKGRAFKALGKNDLAEEAFMKAKEEMD